MFRISKISNFENQDFVFLFRNSKTTKFINFEIKISNFKISKFFNKFRNFIFEIYKFRFEIFISKFRKIFAEIFNEIIELPCSKLIHRKKNIDIQKGSSSCFHSNRRRCRWVFANSRRGAKII